MKAKKKEFKEYKESEEYKERSDCRAEVLLGRRKADLSRRRPGGGGN